MCTKTNYVKFYAATVISLAENYRYDVECWCFDRNKFSSLHLQSRTLYSGQQPRQPYLLKLYQSEVLCHEEG